MSIKRKRLVRNRATAPKVNITVTINIARLADKLVMPEQYPDEFYEKLQNRLVGVAKMGVTEALIRMPD